MLVCINEMRLIIWLYQYYCREMFIVSKILKHNVFLFNVNDSILW